MGSRLLTIIAPLMTALRAVMMVAWAATFGKLLSAFAIGFAVFRGIGGLFDATQTYIRTNMGALGDASAILGLMGADVGINMLLSAMTTVIVIKTAGGVLKKFVFL